MSNSIFAYFYNLLPAIMVISMTIFVGWLISYFFDNKTIALRNSRFHRQLMQLIVGSIAVVTFILVLPINDSVQNQLLGILGLLLTAVIGLSSTTFASNAMAGLMLKVVRNFRKGDFIQVENHFGRVTERGLFHTEIQTPESNLITIPNLFLITQPTTTTRQSGTIVSASVSLGYNLHHDEIFPLLIAAAEITGLREAFVQITNLGDFSVNYRVAGILDDIKTLITSESELRKNILLSLHNANIEIVSPSFINQQRISADHTVIPCNQATTQKSSEIKPESLMFEKADQAELIEKLEVGLEILVNDIEQSKKNIKQLKDKDKSKAEEHIINKTQQLDKLAAKINRLIVNK